MGTVSSDQRLTDQALHAQTSRLLQTPVTFFKMNRVILGVFAAGFCFAFVHALECYNCEIGIGSVCLTTKKTCGTGEHCYSGAGKAIGDLVTITMKGCIAEDKCNKTEAVHWPNNSSKVYDMTKTCCATDLCNAATRLPTVTVLPLTLATLTTIVMAKILVCVCVRVTVRACL